MKQKRNEPEGNCYGDREKEQSSSKHIMTDYLINNLLDFESFRQKSFKNCS